MKNIKSIVLSVLLLSATIGIAQETPAKNISPSERAQKAVEKMDAQLTLTDEQEIRVQSILEQAFTKRKAIINDVTATPETKKAAIKELKQSLNEQMQGTLTEEQYTAWKAMLKAQKKEQMNERNKVDPERAAEQVSQKMKENLNLTDEQTAQVKGILHESFYGRNEVKSRNLPNDELKKEMEIINEETDKQMKRILTPEQYEKYFERAQERRKMHRIK